MSDWLPRVRHGLLAALLLAATGWLLATVDRYFPLEAWLVFRYAAYWAGAGLLLGGALSVGHLVTTRIVGARWPLLERLSVAMAVGLTVLGWVMFLVGITGLLWLRWVVFALVPLALLATGALPLWRTLRRTARLARLAPARHRPLWHGLLTGLGLLAFAVLYFSILTPDNLQYDTRWKQMAIAEDFVASGAIRRFPEGWTTSSRGLLTSILYLWSFLPRELPLFDRVGFAVHFEFALFVWTTLVAVPALTRHLAPGADPRLVWVARFVMPGIFVYDSTLSGGADHVGAAFAVPVALLAFRALRALEPAPTALLAALVGAAMMTKETVAVMFVPIPVALVVARSAWLGGRRLMGKTVGHPHWWWRGPLVAGAVGLAVSSQQWLKNWLWYGNPVYPVAGKYFTPHPWTPDASYMFKQGYAGDEMWSASHDWQGLFDTLEATATWAFHPHAWPPFHGKLPVIGFIFTLLLPLVPFLRRRWKTLWLVLALHGAIALWFWTHHQDRYLQALMPLMAAVIAGTLTQLWQERLLAVRAGIVLLVTAQVLWGLDKPTARTHSMVKSPPKDVIDLLGEGFDISVGLANFHDRLARDERIKPADRAERVAQELRRARGKLGDRLEFQKAFVALDRELPADARVLLHDNHVHLGVNRPCVLDWSTWQYGISYGLHRSPGETWELLRSYGVTHVHWRPRASEGFDSLAGDLRFFGFATRELEDVATIGGNLVGALPEERPADPGPEYVLVSSCRTSPLASGLHRLSDLAVPVYGPKATEFPAPLRPVGSGGLAELARYALYQAHEAGCEGPEDARRGFELVAKRPAHAKGRAYNLYVRQRDESPALLDGGP